MMRVVVIGATGRIGQPLCRALVQRRAGVIVFSRDPIRASEVVAGAAAYVSWSPGELSAECAGHLGSADAVVYLAGAPLFDGRRHARPDVEKESEARVAALGSLVDALGRVDHRPGMLVAASSVGYYGYTSHPDSPLDETHPVGSDWWGRSSAEIEDAALVAKAHGIRTVVLRTGYVLTTDSLAAQVAQFHRHLGGWIGTGLGWTPWIHIADEVGLVLHALEQTGIDGPLNATAPEPVRSRQFACALGRVLGHRAWLAVPTPFVRMGLGAVTDILIKGQHVLPTKAVATSYRFDFPNLDEALRDLVGEQVHETGKSV